MNPRSELLELSASALAQRIARQEVTSVDVVDAHIARAGVVGPRVRALVAERFSAARAEAEAVDRRIRSGEKDLPPLLGVPCSVKEAFAVTGMPWTAGLVARRGVIAPSDAPTVERLRAAGAIVLGVTNTSELCMWIESDNRVYGRTHNAYVPGRTAGGSSGGEGALIGAGASPFGLGSDIGGSIRMPAFFNGVFGHKPSPGLVPNEGQFPLTHDEEFHYLATGPLCRRAEDLAPLLRVLAGPGASIGDPTTVDVEGLRVVDCRGDGHTRIDRRLWSTQARAATHLGAAGAEIRRLGFGELRDAWMIWALGIGESEPVGAFRERLGIRRRRDLLPHLVAAMFRRGPHTLPAAILGVIEDVVQPSGVEVARIQRSAKRLREAFLEEIGDGVLMYPSYPLVAPKHGRPMLRPFAWVYTGIFNALGFPATQVPLGLIDGLPVGLQVVAAPGRDHVSIAVALELERAFGGWVPPWRAPDYRG